MPKLRAEKWLTNIVKITKILDEYDADKLSFKEASMQVSALTIDFPSDASDFLISSISEAAADKREFAILLEYLRSRPTEPEFIRHINSS